LGKKSGMEKENIWNLNVQLTGFYRYVVEALKRPASPGGGGGGGKNGGGNLPFGKIDWQARPQPALHPTQWGLGC